MPWTSRDFAFSFLTTADERKKAEGNSKGVKPLPLPRNRWGMDVLDYCRAMASYCRQRTQFDGEDPAFWSEEAAQWERLLRDHGRPGTGANRSLISPTTPKHRVMADGDEALRYRSPKPAAECPLCGGPF